MTPTYDDAHSWQGTGVGKIIALDSRLKINTGKPQGGNSPPPTLRHQTSGNAPDVLRGVLNLVVDVRSKLASATSVRLFVAANAFDRAAQWRAARGAGTALALPWGVDPKSIPWPPVALVAVILDGPPQSFMLADMQALAAALRRDGVGYTAFQHADVWSNLWSQRAAAGGGT